MIDQLGGWAMNRLEKKLIEILKNLRENYGEITLLSRIISGPFWTLLGLHFI